MYNLNTRHPSDNLSILKIHFSKYILVPIEYIWAPFKRVKRLFCTFFWVLRVYYCKHTVIKAFHDCGNLLCNLSVHVSIKHLTSTEWCWKIPWCTTSWAHYAREHCMPLQNISHHTTVADLVSDVVPGPMDNPSQNQPWISTCVTW